MQQQKNKNLINLVFKYMALCYGSKHTIIVKISTSYAQKYAQKRSTGTRIYLFGFI